MLAPSGRAPARRVNLAWTPKRRQKFLARLGETGNVSRAASLTGVSRRHAYRLRSSEPEFAEAWEAALEDFADHVLEAVRRRAVEGTRRPILSAGKVVCHETVYSDRLLLRLLEAYRPEKYRRSSPARRGSLKNQQ